MESGRGGAHGGQGWSIAGSSSISGSPSPSLSDMSTWRIRSDEYQQQGQHVHQQYTPGIPAIQTQQTLVYDSESFRKKTEPLFDFPAFTRQRDSIRPSMALGYDIKDLLNENGKRKREEKLKKIADILAENSHSKRLGQEKVLQLQIEEKKLQLADVQARIRADIEKQQKDIMNMPERSYRKFVRSCAREREEQARQVQAFQKAKREKQIRSIFQGRKKFFDAQSAIRDARTARNKGIFKYHERMLKKFSKRKDENHDKRIEALKNNDVERYREMLLEQQAKVPGDASERYAVLSSILSQTEEYIQKLGTKIMSTKPQELVKENEINAPGNSSSVHKYYNLAHAVEERVTRQPSMLRAGTLREYQLVGLQWMLSLYNNNLNGILADEMGLGKTVQVMALIAYLMEFKGNYGPYLIIVPNAVLVNWRSELHTWLPSVSCIFYVGNKDQRAKLFSQEVMAMKFNILVTTYEFIMIDRAKLSKIDWKYIIIDEAQRMKDRDSVLARDLNKYRCERRLLLTGTPLQNDLKELWSLLNLLLPQVFDNQKAFHEWFSQPFQKEGSTHNSYDDWIETEKKVIIIHRLHQILEPFMLRRRVEEVEGSLPPKVSIVLQCKMSAFQSAIYDWVKATGTIRVDPEEEKLKAQRNRIYEPKTYKTVNNRCMELRKTCNHPLLNYPSFDDCSKDFLVKSCGKLWVLDNILIKLQRTGHRVLLFSTMTKLLDILEEYLEWRGLVFSRIDGTTSLEERESAIMDFNSPNSDCFIFLLSIRAAGRGLNLQSADTVIIYDPDPNPKNEEQAIARAHRIGQTREVKVIYMEAVISGKDGYMGSIESLIRKNIQQYKIEMANEVINAGRFDQRTTHEERRLTLESLLRDEDKFQEIVHDVPSLKDMNRMIARSEEEVAIFDKIDSKFQAEKMIGFDQVPEWLLPSAREVGATIAKLSKKPSKKTLLGASHGLAPETEKGRVREKDDAEEGNEVSPTPLNKDEGSSLDNRAFVSHPELDARPSGSRSKKMSVEISVSEKSHMDMQHDGDKDEDEKVIKRKKSDAPLKHNSGTPEDIQRKCKKVIARLQKKIEKEGEENTPMLSELWKSSDGSISLSWTRGTLLDLKTINMRVQSSSYSELKQLVADVQLMIKHALHYHDFSHQVKSEAKKVHDLFFNILEKTCPGYDFQEAEDLMNFSGPESLVTAGSSSGPSIDLLFKRWEKMKE